MELIRDRTFIATDRMKRRALRRLVRHFVPRYGASILHESPGTLQLKARELIPEIKASRNNRPFECAILIDTCVDYREIAELLAVFRYIGSTKILIF